jgi:RNA polymerase sigma-70 factor (ECF subfamily)
MPLKYWSRATSVWYTDLRRRFAKQTAERSEHRTRSFEDAKDVAQEVFLQAYLNLGKLENPEKLASWIHTVTIRICNRWNQRYSKTVFIDELEEGALDNLYAERIPTPAEECERREMKEIVMDALKALPEKVSEVLMLYYMEDLSYQRIAKFLDLPVSTVKGRLQMGRRQLKEEMLKMVSKTIEGQRPEKQFTEKVVKEILEQVKKSSQEWNREDFANYTAKAEEAISKMSDETVRTKNRFELLDLHAKAAASWMGEPNVAYAKYEEALNLSREVDDKQRQADVLMSMAITACDQGILGKMSQYATQAVEIYDEMGEYLKSAQCVAMVELERMPDLGLPGESRERNVIGGYLLKSTPISGGISYIYEEAEGRRNAAFAKVYGCPSMTNLFAYLFRTKTLLKLPADAAGASWTDGFDPVGRFFGWPTWDVYSDAEFEKLVATSVIESQNERVVVPAGSFENCLKVVTEIQPAGGKYAVTIQERVYSGKRTIWFAPGVGIVQIRYECDDILLVDYDVRSESDEYLPLDVDNRWRYQWVCGDREWNTPAMYNEIVRVTAKSDGNNYIACAAYRFELEKQSQKEHHRNLLHTFRHTGDREGEKFALLDLGRITREDEKEESIKYYEELRKLSVESGDRVYELKMQSALEILRGGDEYKSKLQCEQEILKIHRTSGDKFAECKTLESIARLHSGNNHYQEAIPYYESAVKLNAKLGDFDSQKICQAETDFCRQATEDLENVIQAAYLYGEFTMYRDDSQIKGGSSGYSTIGEWPIGSGHGTPIDHLALLTNVNIDRKPKIGKIWTDSIGLGMVRARGQSEIAGVNESVTVPAGTFENCLFIRSEFVSSAENELVPEHKREVWEGYLAGTRLLWFAPGVGLVKCHYKHANGAVTDLHLSEYSVKEGNDDYIPLDVGNWWRHEWTEKKSRTSFMQLTKVVAEEKKEEMRVFHLSFTTRATKMT